MVNLKDYLGKLLVGKLVRLKCECLTPFDITGRIVKYDIISNEIVWTIEKDGKQVKVGENTPKLSIAIL